MFTPNMAMDPGVTKEDEPIVDEDMQDPVYPPVESDNDEESAKLPKPIRRSGRKPQRSRTKATQEPLIGKMPMVRKTSKKSKEASSSSKDPYYSCAEQLYLSSITFPIFCSLLHCAEADWKYDWFLQQQYLISSSNEEKTPFPFDLWQSEQVQTISKPLDILDGDGVTVEECTTEASEFEGADLSRLPPRKYLASNAAKNAIRKEIFGLLKGRVGHEPPLSIVSRSQKQSCPGECVPTTLIVRLKPNGVVKARLCVRGDCMRGSQRQFVSAPTADRCLIRILLSCASSYEFEVLVCDISQAFLQADVLPANERYYLYPPACIELKSDVWGGSILEKPLKASECVYPWLFRCNRPLYGSTDAPLRWYVTLASRLRKYKYHPHRTDLCFFSRRDSESGKISALILIHVDDIVMTGTPMEMKKFVAFLDTFAHGTIDYVRPDQSVMYCGLELFRRHKSYGISQDSYRSNVHILQPNDFMGSGAIYTTADHRKKQMGKFMGGLSWLTQIRFDLAFIVTLIATSISMAVQNDRFLPHFFRICALAVKLMHGKDVAIWYHPIPFLGANHHPLQIISFSDAGFANLPMGGSTESHFIGIGRPLSRDGVIQCVFHPILRGARKIHRAVRSSLASEAIALCSTIDLTYWLQSILHEAFFGEFKRDGFSVSAQSPLLSPFPSEVSQHDHWFTNMHSEKLSEAVHGARIHNTWMFAFLEEPNATLIPLSVFRTGYDHIWNVDNPNTHSRHISLLILTDSANTFSASHNGNPRSLGKHTRIHLCYIRDGINRYNLSFVAAGFNLADCGTKLRGSVQLVLRVWESNRCEIGFLSRAEMEKIKLSLQEHAQDADKFVPL